MAVNKRKVLDAARKYAQKGAKEKALKEYHTLLKLDPRDAKLHLEIGDCYRRWGQIEEAITQYSRVAEQYKGDGFDARAVAVFKQILNLDPKRYPAHVSLSELYQRMGLDSEALVSLQAAADGYHKEGRKREALELLRRMATLDPTNTTSRLKVAELLRAEGMDDDAVAEYEAVVVELGRQGATETAISVRERILDMQPERADVMLGIARGLVSLGSPERAEPFAKKALAVDGEDTAIHELLCDIYKALGKDSELTAITRRLAQAYRDRGDEDRAREVSQRLPMSLDLDSESPDDGSEAADASSVLEDDDLLEDEDFLADDAPDIGQSLPLGDNDELELELDDDDDFSLEPGGDDDPLSVSGAQEPAVASAAMPEGDPEQLLAEASVYLRYGKVDQAIASLQAALAQEPDHRPALEKLGETYSASERVEEAVEAWCRAAAIALEEDDESGWEVLRDRIAALDAEAAEQLVPPDFGAREEPAEIEEQHDLDVDSASRHEVDPEEVDIDFDVDFEAATDEVDVSAGIEEAAADDGSEGSVEFEFDDGVDVEFEEDAFGGDGAVAASGEEEPEETTAVGGRPPGGASESSAQQVEEDLEEAEFYYQQELFDEAEVIYRRILTVAPKHPSALLRLGELAARKGADPGAVGAHEEASPVRAAFEAATPDESASPHEVAESAFEIDVDEIEIGGGSESEAEETVAAEIGEVTIEDIETEVSFEIEEGSDAEPVAEDSVVEEPASSDEDSTEVAMVTPDAGEVEDEIQIGASSADWQPAVPESVESEAPEPGVDGEDALDGHAIEDAVAAAADVGDGGGDFDLAAELRDVIEEDENESSASGHAAARGLSTLEDGFESIFADFKQGVSATLSEDDYETRYDLGIAYREMELFDDAIGEFKLCLGNPARKVASLHMMGLCALDLGRHEDATSHLEQAMASPDLPAGQRAGICFDLGRVFEARGDSSRAHETYQRVRQFDPDFPGVAARLDAISLAQASGGSPIELQAEEDGYESFEDWIDDEPEASAETFESFDDVITDAEAVSGDSLPRGGVADPAPGEAATPNGTGADPLEEVAELEVEPMEADPIPDPGEPTPKKRRRKKISFV